MDCSPLGSPVPGILQARTLEWVAISSSNAWKWKMKAKSLSRVQPSQPHGLPPSRLLCPRDFPGRSTGVGYHFLLHRIFLTQGLNPCPLCLLLWQADSLPAKWLGMTVTIILTVMEYPFSQKTKEEKALGSTGGCSHTFSSEVWITDLLHCELPNVLNFFWWDQQWY